MAPTPFIATGEHPGSDKCDVVIERLHAAEIHGHADDQVMTGEAAIHILNASVAGEGVLELSGLRTTATIRPTATTFHQDGITVTGFMTTCEGDDGQGNGWRIEPATLVRARLTYHHG